MKWSLRKHIALKVVRSCNKLNFFYEKLHGTLIVRFSLIMDRSKKEAVICAKSLILASEKINILLSIDL